MRTHHCGLIDEALIGHTVTLCGWADVARNLGGLCFIDLRDHEGIVQIVAEPDGNVSGNADVITAAAHIGYEDCLRITGTVRARHAVNDKIRSGKVEVVATRIELLNKADPLPFHGMSSYPYPSSEHYPDTGETRAYRMTYNTRPGLRLIRPLVGDVTRKIERPSSPMGN